MARALQGPTISPVYSSVPGDNGSANVVAQQGFYAATICVPKKLLYQSVKELRQVNLLRPMCHQVSIDMTCILFHLPLPYSLAMEVNAQTCLEDNSAGLLCM